MPTLEKIYVKTIQYGIYVILFLPLFISKAYYFPYIFGKAIVLRSIIEIITVLYVLLAVSNSKYRPKPSPIFWGVAVYMGIKIITTLSSANIYHSFWSNYERMEGLLTLLHFGALFIIAVSVFRTKKEWKNLLRVGVLASFFVALFGLGQKLNLDFLFHSGVSKIDSTLGNSSYVAAYLGANIFITLYLFFQDKSLWWRIPYGISILLELVIIYFTASRGGILGLIGGLLILLFLCLLFSRGEFVRKSKKYILAGLILFFLFGFFIYINRNSSWVQNTHGLKKVIMISTRDRTVKDRYLNWNFGWQGLKERPLRGWGMENYYIVFNKYYNSQTSEPWFDRAHNIIFDQAVSAGVFGLLSYLFMIFGSIYYLWQYRRQDEISHFICIALLLASFFANFFVFDCSSTYTVFFLVLAFINFLVFIKDKRPLNEEGDQRRSASIFLPLSLVIVLCLGLYFFNIRPVIANNIGVEAYKYSRVDQEKTIKLFKKALAYNTFGNPEIRLRIGDYALSLADDNDKKEAALKTLAFASEELEKSIEKDEPLNARYYLYLGGLYNVYARVADKAENINQALKYLNKAREMSPRRQEIYFELGQSYVSLGDYAVAIKNFEKAVEIKSDPVSEYNLLLIYLYAKDKEKSEVQFSKISREIKWAGYGKDKLEKIISLYNGRDQFAEIITILNFYLETYPGDAAYRAKLAAVYAQAGQKEKAREEVLKAVELDPGLETEAEMFLKGLE